MSKHTPGSWEVGLDGRSIMADRGDNATGLPIRQCVAIVKERMEGTEANARLIATAPQLLDEVRSYRNLCEVLLDGAPSEEIARNLKKRIDKAIAVLANAVPQ